MKLKVISTFIITIILCMNCSPISHIQVGELRTPIDPSEVKVYADFPENYEKIAIIEASSNFALKDPEILFSHQAKTDKSLSRLKLRASELGANGIVIKNLTTRINQNVNVWSDNDGDVHSTTSNDPQKAISAIAIFVK